MNTLTEIYELGKIIFILLLFISVLGFLSTIILDKLLGDPIKPCDEQGDNDDDNQIFINP